ncbi:MAG: hypothetical protein JO000_06605 [Alphaproteobacteria bacterium]|nr:hypothetical protein [Alphaproteobacteria bacterium]
MNKLTSVLATVLVIGSASVALADDYTDQAADALRNFGPVASQQTLTTRPVALPRHKVQINDSSWMDRASQTFSGGY